MCFVQCFTKSILTCLIQISDLTLINFENQIKSNLSGSCQGNAGQTAFYRIKYSVKMLVPCSLFVVLCTVLYTCILSRLDSNQVKYILKSCFHAGQRGADGLLPHQVLRQDAHPAGGRRRETRSPVPPQPLGLQPRVKSLRSSYTGLGKQPRVGYNPV